MQIASRQVRRIALWALVVSLLLYIGWAHVEGYRAAVRGETPLFTDYTHTYATALLVREKPAENLYIPREMAAASRRAAHAMYPGISDQQAHRVGFAPMMYPPSVMLLVAPLAWLPYFTSWFVWCALTALPLMAALRRIAGGAALPAALAAPPVFFNLMYGQTGFFTGGLLGLGLALLARHPLWAGVLIGLVSVKPHFGVLIPLAFAAGGHWRAIGGAVLSTTGLIVLSVWVFGDDPWFGWIATALFHLDGFRAGAFAWPAMTSVLSGGVMAGLGLRMAWAIQWAVAALVTLVVAWAWWRGRQRADTLGLQAALLCAGTPLVVPMVYLYDLVLLVPAVAWVWLDLQRHGGRLWEYVLLFGGHAALLGVLWLAWTVGMQFGPLLVGSLFLLALSRYRQSLNRQTDAQVDLATAPEPRAVTN